MNKPPSKSLSDLTATEIVSSIAAGKTTCERVARACLERIAERDPKVLAWQYVNPEQVIAYAKELDASGRGGPLRGVPFGVKDIIDTCDMPTEYGSPIYRQHQPASDAACVALSRKAGAVLMGKTVSTEFAYRHPAKTRNPLDPARTPGGSSSGSGAAVGDNMVPLAIGTQTLASTIRPGSFCGVFAYRPTHGDLRCAGVKEVSSYLDTPGLFARSVPDIVLYRNVLLGIKPEPLEPLMQPLRIGFCRTYLWPKLEPHMQRSLEDAAQTLARAGATVTELTLPPQFADIEEKSHRWISGFEMSRNMTWEIEHHWEKLSDTLRNGRLQDGLTCSFDRYRSALQFAAHCRDQLGSIFNDYDILITASATGEAPVGLHSTGNGSLSVIWTTTHVPAMTVPVFSGPNGLPMGAQLIAKRGADRALFAASQWIHQVLT